MGRKDDFDVASERGKKMLAMVPHAVAARYDRRVHRIVVDLSAGYSIAFRRTDAEGLEYGSWEQLSDIQISASGYGLHFPKLDADLWIPGLLQGRFGSEKWMAERTTRRGTTSAGDVQQKERAA